MDDLVRYLLFDRTLLNNALTDSEKVTQLGHARQFVQNDPQTSAFITAAILFLENSQNEQFLNDVVNQFQEEAMLRFLQSSTPVEMC